MCVVITSEYIFEKPAICKENKSKILSQKKKVNMRLYCQHVTTQLVALPYHWLTSVNRRIHEYLISINRINCYVAALQEKKYKKNIFAWDLSICFIYHKTYSNAGQATGKSLFRAIDDRNVYDHAGTTN